MTEEGDIGPDDGDLPDQEAFHRGATVGAGDGHRKAVIRTDSADAGAGVVVGEDDGFEENDGGDDGRGMLEKLYCKA